MKRHTSFASALTLALASVVALPGCAVIRDQQSVGSYIDDTTITTQVKSRMASNTTVDAAAINVETLKGVVQLSGFAKSQAEKEAAERIARDVNGVKSVRNSIVVRG